MRKFNNRRKEEMPSVNTVSLPDLIFILLFLFVMITTVGKVRLKSEFARRQQLPLERLEKKTLETFVYVGQSGEQYRARLGTGKRILLNDCFIKISDLNDCISGERAGMQEADRLRMKVSVKVDENAKMGLVDDVKKALQELFPLEIDYSVVKRREK